MTQIVKLSSFILLLSLLMFTLVRAEQSTVQRRSRARAFIDSQCQTTLYPNECVHSLSYYVSNFTSNLSHRQLVHVALKVALIKGESTRAYVTDVAKDLKRTKGKDYQAVEECLSQINDGVDQLTNCIEETQKIKEDRDFPWHASNVQTWMSTALTDSSMCIDGVSGQAIHGRTKALIKAKVLNLHQVTSNALALFNRFASRYRSSHDKKPKV